MPLYKWLELATSAATVGIIWYVANPLSPLAFSPAEDGILGIALGAVIYLSFEVASK